MVFLQQDILGLDVAMYDVVAVRVVESAGDLERDPNCVLNLQS